MTDGGSRKRKPVAERRKREKKNDKINRISQQATAPPETKSRSGRSKQKPSKGEKTKEREGVTLPVVTFAVFTS